MENSSSPEAELERFRQQWKAEVQARNATACTIKADQGHEATSDSGCGRPRQDASERVAQYEPVQDGDPKPRIHDESEISQTRPILDGDVFGVTNALSQMSGELKTALDHYEKAVESEAQGKLGDSLKLYRTAFKLDARVQEDYKNKYCPEVKLDSSRSTTLSRCKNEDTRAETTAASSITELIYGFADFRIQGEPPLTELSPGLSCPFSEMPDEVLVEILIQIAFSDMTSLSRISQTCKRLAYLVSTEDAIWKRLVHDESFGFLAMLYKFTCSIGWVKLVNGILPNGLGESELDNSLLLPDLKPGNALSLLPAYPSYRQMFRSRPRLRFNGCYISTCNYTRPGATASNTLLWQQHILIVTYYRYLRFFPDGSVISLLTTSDPADVVPLLHKENMHHHRQAGTALPPAVMKDAHKGCWRLTGDPLGMKAHQANHLGYEYEAEEEGDVHIETEGVVPRYNYIMQLHLASAGRGVRNNKLNWEGYWSHNILTDDVAEFARKNERPFFWSRVRSWV